MGRGDPKTPADRATIRPQPGAQEAFLSTPADIAVFGGTRGPGKTFSLLLESLRHVGVKGFTAVMFRRTYPEMIQAGGLWMTSFDLYPALSGRPRQDVLQWRFPAGTTVKFSHMQHESDRLSWKGAQITLLAFDQLEGFTAEQFWFLLSCLRGTTRIAPYVRASCNPVPEDDPVGGWLHTFLAWWIDEATGWPRWERAGVLRWFIRDPETDAIDWAATREELVARHTRVAPQSVTFLPGRLEENRILAARDPLYREKLEMLPRVERLRAFGNWTARATAGSVFNRAWFPIVLASPCEARRVRYWDKAGTEDSGDYSAGVRLAEADGIYFVEDVVRGQWSSRQRNAVMRQTAQLDGLDVPIWIEQEGGSGGKESAELSIRDLAGWSVRTEPVTGDKVTRAGPISAQAEAGNVRLVAGEWNADLLTELHNFPDGKYDDQVDALAGAFNKLALQGGAPVFGILGGPVPQKTEAEQQAVEAERRRLAAETLAEMVRRQGMYWPPGR